jgi:transposase-like protein
LPPNAAAAAVPAKSWVAARRVIISDPSLIFLAMLHLTYPAATGRFAVKEKTAMQSALSAPHFHNEQAAFAYVEARLWPNGPVCPHCKGTERIGALKGKTTRPGLYKCYVCRKPFTVRMGTLFESSHVPLRYWLQAIYLMCASKKGISTRQLHRTFGGSLKTAWFLSHRIREAMKPVAGSEDPMGGPGGIVEIDETFFGRKKGATKKRGWGHKNAIMSLVERRPGGARVMSFHVASTRSVDLLPIIKANVAKESHIMTDEATHYSMLNKHFEAHDFTNHNKGEYVRGIVHSNTAEGFYSVFKRGMIGIYQHCAEHHLRRYTAEFDFRYNTRIRLGTNDKGRADMALCGVIGKRLTYRTTGGFRAAV